MVSVTVRLHDNLHILVERYQEAQKAFHGKLPELTAQHLRNIGLADSEQAGGLHLFIMWSAAYGVRFHTTSTTSAPIAGVRLVHIC